MSAYLSGMYDYVSGFYYRKEVPPPPPPPPPPAPSSFEDFLAPLEMLGPLKNNVDHFIAKAEESDLTQQKVIGAWRAIFAVVQISLAPGGGVIGALLAAGDTQTAELICNRIDAAAEGAWRDLVFQKKLFILSAGIALGMTPYFSIPLFSGLSVGVAWFYAAKCGADFTVQYNAGEARLNRQKAILDEAEKGKVATD